MRLALAVTLSCAALLGCAYAQTPVEIADGRSGSEWVDLSAWATAAPMQQASAAARSYWQGKDASYEEDLRIFAVAEGAFTEPGAQQQAVLFVMSVWPRCCPKTGLAVVEGDRLVRNVAFEGVAQGLSAVPDLDGDGRDELALTGEFGMGGQVSRSVTLASFGTEGLADWGSTSLLDDSCAAGYDGSSATHVTALPGPTFTVERYARASCESETWEPVGGPEALELVAPETSPYVDLRVP
ncbi:MAG: hypothetical protein ABJF88_13405 [Rhodothermales bacterium]